MIRLLFAAVLLLSPSQDGAPQDQVIKGRLWDPEEPGAVRAEFEGYGHLDHEKGTGRLTRVEVKFYSKPNRGQPSHTIRLFANRCDLEGVGEATREKGMIRFYDGLRVLIDDEVRLWTPEGTLDTGKQILKCPRNTRLVRFLWPPELTLASVLAFMDPAELEWLKLFGAPEPVFELAGDDFEFDAASYVFTAGKNGRLRVKGSPGEGLGSGPKKAKKRAKPSEPTELACEGPLVLRNLGAPEPEGWTTLHITAERKVVIEHRAKESFTRAASDSASFYLSVPPEEAKADPRPLSVVLSGSVRIGESRGFDTACDYLEWNHQDDLLRLRGSPRVVMMQGGQRLQAREVVTDRWNRTIDFKGDIVATFRPGGDPAAADPPGGLMTLSPGDLRIRTDPTGRPLGLHARNGVRISSPNDAGGEGIDAEGTEFEWDLVTGEGLLRGAPFARLEQGGNFIAAPLVTFQGESFDRSLMVVKGPKVMKFFYESDPPRNPAGPAVDAAVGLPGFRPKIDEPTLNSSAAILEAALGMPGLQGIPGRKESVMDLVIACDGDAVLDQVAGSVKLVDRCSVRAQDSTLFADRLFVFLSRGRRGPELDRVLGNGNVRATRRPGPKSEELLIEGETLELSLDPSTRERIVTVVGQPNVRARMGSDEFEYEKVVYNLDREPPKAKFYRGGKR